MLFKVEDIAPVLAEKEAKNSTYKLSNVKLVDGRSLKIAESLPGLVADSFVPFVSKGAWSMHDLLLYVLSLTGPADVHFCTWSMTEEPCRQLIRAMNEGLILSLTGLLDVRVKVRNKAVLEFAKMNMTMIREAICHAKVTVIENDRWQVSIVGSANMTNNPRIEAGVLIVNSKIADFNRTWILDEIEKAGHIE
jgi:hypothetical protein